MFNYSSLSLFFSSFPPVFCLLLSFCYFAGRTVISVPPSDQRVIKGTTATLECNATHDSRINVRYLLVSLCVYVHTVYAYLLILLVSVSLLCVVCKYLYIHVYLHCCSFKWDRGGVPVLPSSGGRVSVRQGSLTIGQTWSGDIGDYTCTVTSQAGNDSRSARLEVM